MAVDTELVWEHTYYPHLGIVQLAFPDADHPESVECHLIDATAVDMKALGALLGDSGTTKILHDAVQDLAILRSVTKVSPRAVFDTRTAAGFAGLTSTISLRDLLVILLGVELEKTETRTNWLRRPLTETQVGYALDDVRFLHSAHLELVRRARERNVEVWLNEEMATLDNGGLYEERDPQQQYKRIKGRGRLSRRELAILRELAVWRECEARVVDRPRGRVMSDHLLLLLAQRKPASSEELSQLRKFREGQLRRHGKAILDVVKKGLAIDDEDLPVGHPRLHYDKTFDRRATAAIKLVEQRSADRGIDHALVATRSQIRTLVRDRSDPKEDHHELLRGWRREFIGTELLAQIRE